MLVAYASDLSAKYVRYSCFRLTLVDTVKVAYIYFTSAALSQSDEYPKSHTIDQVKMKCCLPYCLHVSQWILVCFQQLCPKLGHNLHNNDKVLCDQTPMWKVMHQFYFNI